MLDRVQPHERPVEVDLQIVHPDRIRVGGAVDDDPVAGGGVAPDDVDGGVSAFQQVDRDGVVAFARVQAHQAREAREAGVNQDRVAAAQRGDDQVVDVRVKHLTHGPEEHQAAHEQGVGRVGQEQQERIVARPAIQQPRHRRHPAQVEDVRAGAARDVLEPGKGRLATHAPHVRTRQRPEGGHVRPDERIGAGAAHEHLDPTEVLPNGRRGVGLEIDGHRVGATGELEQIRAGRTLDPFRDGGGVVVEPELVVATAAHQPFGVAEVKPDRRRHVTLVDARDVPNAARRRPIDRVAATPAMDDQACQSGQHAHDHDDVVAVAAVDGQVDDGRQVDRGPAHVKDRADHIDHIRPAGAAHAQNRGGRAEAHHLDRVVVGERLVAVGHQVGGARRGGLQVAGRRNVQRVRPARRRQRSAVAHPHRHHPRERVQEHVVSVRGILAIEHQRVGARIRDAEPVVPGRPRQAQHLDAAIVEDAGANLNRRQRHREGVGPGRAHDGQLIAVARADPRVGNGGPRHRAAVDGHLVCPARPVDQQGAAPVRGGKDIAAGAADQLHRGHVQELEAFPVARGEDIPVQAPIGVGARDQGVAADTTVEREPAGELLIAGAARDGATFRLDPEIAGRHKLADRRRFEFRRERGQDVIASPQEDREVLQAVGGQPIGPDRHPVAPRARLHRDARDVEEVEVGRAHATHRARNRIREGAADDLVLALRIGDGQRRRHLADEGVARALGVAGIRTPIQLRRADQDLPGADRHRVAHVIPGEGIRAKERTHQRLETPLAILEPEGERRAFVALGHIGPKLDPRDVAARRAHHQQRSLQRHRVPKAVVRRGRVGVLRVRPYGELLRLAPGRACAQENVGRASQIRGAGRAHHDAVAVHIDRGPEAVIRRRIEGHEVRALLEPRRARTDIDHDRAPTLVRGGSADERRAPIQGHRAPEGPAAGHPLLLGPADIASPVEVDRVPARGADQRRVHVHVQRRAESLARASHQLGLLHPALAEPLEHVDRARPIALVGGAHEQRVAPQADRRPEPVMDLPVAGLDHPLVHPRPRVRVPSVNEDRAPIVVVLGADGGRGSVNGNVGSELGRAQGLGGIDRARGHGRPGGTTLAEVVNDIRDVVGVPRAHHVEAL